MTQIKIFKEYLKGLRNCNDDERFHKEFGIGQNWPIFMNADIERVVKDLCSSRDYSLRLKEEDYEGKKFILDYVPGTVVVNVMNWIGKMYTVGDGKERNRQITNYNMTMILNPYQQPKRIPEVSMDKATALVISDLGDYIQENKIPACFSLWPPNQGLRPIYHNP